MKLSKLVGDRFKERPSDCVIDSHALMVRGGYMKYVANGIISQYSRFVVYARKLKQLSVTRWIKSMDRKYSFRLPCRHLYGKNPEDMKALEVKLLRFKDRNGSKMVLGMTHEEAAVQLVREYGQTYAKYPFMIYQFQTKFRVKHVQEPV